MKICAKCKVEKDFSCFWKRKQIKDGYNTRCIECLTTEEEREKKRKRAERFRQRKKNKKIEDGTILTSCIICENSLRGNQRKYCSNKCKAKGHYNSRNTYIRQTTKAIERRLHFIKSKGGCCEVCGYDKNMAALEFHHVVENTKNFNLDSRAMGNRSMESLKEEVEKCSLLCSNCHREHHNPEYDMSMLLNTEKERLFEEFQKQKTKK